MLPVVPLIVFPALLFSPTIAAEVEGESWGVLGTERDFLCPPNDTISPCNCFMVPPVPMIHCSGVRSLKTLVRTLSGIMLHGNSIPYLKIEDCPIVGLPSNAFQNLNITRLMISNSNLTYIAPDAFAGLESLTLLVLHNVKLFEFPTESLSRLQALRTLSLVGNRLSRITRDDLRDLNSIRYFGLRGNRLAHIERGSFSSNLITLSLSKNHLLSLNKTIRHIPYLETLYLEENRLTTIEGELNGLFNLKFLYLANNLLRTLGDSFSDLRNLKCLELQYNSIYSIGDSLRYLINLQSLNLSQNILFQLHSSSFRHLNSLELLDLSGNHLTSLDGSLIPLVRLATLDLSENALYNFTYMEIHSMNRLKVLNLQGNQLPSVSCTMPSSFRTITLEMLFLSKNHLAALGGFLHRFPNLEFLDLSHNLLQRLWQRDVENTTRLQYINVRGNPLACDMHQLEVLHGIESRRAEIEGKPDCPSDIPIRLR